MSTFDGHRWLRRIVALLWLCLAGLAHGQSGTPTYLYTSAYTIDAGSPVTFTVGVNSLTATGTVTFMDGNTPIGTRPLVASEASLAATFTMGGSHVISAVYSGDGGNAPGTSGTLTVRVVHGVTTTTLASSVNPAGIGQPFTLTATVTGSDPMGYVSIYDGGVFLTTVGLNNGVATLEWGFWYASSHSFTAVFADDYYNGTSTSNTVIQLIATQAASTTQLTSSINPSGVGQSTSLTAAVSGASPTGTVTFKDGTTTLGTAALNGGSATLSRSFSTLGAHSLTASYGGDAANTSSNSATLAQTVNALANSATTLASTVNPSLSGQSTTLRAGVTGFNPTGTVTFKDGATVLGSAALASGVATLAAAFSATGTHGITAVYGGDAANAPSTSAAVQQTVNAPTATSTVLTTAVNPAVVAQATTLTATVTGGAPTGSVTFKDGATTLGTAPLASGRASLTASFATTGTHALTAIYGGDTTNAASTSAAISQTVNAQTLSSTTLASSINPSGPGQATVLRATVSGTAPSGTVTFKDGATVLGSGALAAGVATLSTSFTMAGAHVLTAAYGGDPSNVASTSANLSQTVNALASTSTVLSSSVNPAFVSQNTTLTAAVSGTSPTGTVIFKDGTTTLGTMSLVAGVATLTQNFAMTGPHGLTAVYSGDGANAPSTSPPVMETVNPKVSSTTTLTASVNPAFVGQNTVLTATVAGSSPSGSVTFNDGTTSLGSATLIGGVATLTKNFATTGAHSLTAVYAGDAGNASSTSAAVSQTVNAQASSSTALASSVNPTFIGQATTLTATVTGSSPTGTVTFKDGTTTLGTSSLTNGTASLVQSFPTAATHSLSAVYAGDAGNATSTSSAVGQTVKALSGTTTTLASSLNPAGAGQSFTLTATVAGVSPTGTVTFKNGASSVGTAAVSGGIATLGVSMPSAGSYILSAAYSGDIANNPSTSGALTQVVNALAASSVALSSSVNPSTPAQPTTLTARVSGVNPTGSVTFKDGTTALGTASLSAGVATLRPDLRGGVAQSDGGLRRRLVERRGHLSRPDAGLVEGRDDDLRRFRHQSVAAGPVGDGDCKGAGQFADGQRVVHARRSRGRLAGTELRASELFFLLRDPGNAFAGRHVSRRCGQCDEHGPRRDPDHRGCVDRHDTECVTEPGPGHGHDHAFVARHGCGGAHRIRRIEGRSRGAEHRRCIGGPGYGDGHTPAGIHSLTARYLGDPDNLASSSSALVETVNTITTSTTLASSANPAAVAQAVTLTAAVTGGVNPNGLTMIFKDGAANLGSAVISGRTATLAATFSTPGVHSVTATMTGNSQNLSSVSPAVLQSVGPTSTTLASSVNPAALAQNIVFTATVAGASPTGAVSFRDGGSLIGTAAVQVGVATLQASLAARGDHQITASYGGDATQCAQFRRHGRTSLVDRRGALHQHQSGRARPVGAPGGDGDRQLAKRNRDIQGRHQCPRHPHAVERKCELEHGVRVGRRSHVDGHVFGRCRQRRGDFRRVGTASRRVGRCRCRADDLELSVRRSGQHDDHHRSEWKPDPEDLRPAAPAREPCRAGTGGRYARAHDDVQL